MARAQVAHRLVGQPFGVEDLDPGEQHDLVEVRVEPDATVLDCVSARGLAAVEYPADGPGGTVGHDVCRPIGAAAHADGQDGIACRSAARGTTDADEELALFDRAAQQLVAITARRPFAEWYLGAA